MATSWRLISRSAPTRRLPAWVTVTVALVGSTVVSAAIERDFEPANLIMVYLAGVVYAALRHGRGAALATVFGSVLLFDLLFVAPRWELKPTDPQYFFTFAVMMFVGLVVSHLAARTNRQARCTENRAQRMHALNQLALQLAAARTADEIGAALQATVWQALGLAARLVCVDDDGRLPDVGTADTAPAADGSTQRRDSFPLQVAGRLLGVLAVDRAATATEPADDEALLKAIANQGAVALERTLFERRSASAAVEAERERLRSTLLAGISHDFRTPLTTIVGSATSLLEQRDAIDEAHRDALLRGVLLEAQRMHALTSDLLDLTRMEEGAVRLSLEWCPADELVAEACAALGAQLDDRHVQIDAAGETVVWCDPRLVGQALANMLGNAVRHTPHGASIRVGVSASAGTWRLLVHDNGPGIPAGQEREVFKKFFRGWQEQESRGTGLGLAICAVVAELHGGTIVARNDRGACFEMTLPQPDDPAARLQDDE